MHQHFSWCEILSKCEKEKRKYSINIPSFLKKISPNFKRKFGYILDMKNLEKTKILLYSWLPLQTYHKNLTIWIFFL
jgi:hypothetical protein